MAFRAEPGAGATGPHVCPQCPNKTFARLCDLNKHAKSHSRPYKCKEPGCKYGTLGWPTAKELERHHNDKHSASPRTYPCLFQPCTYWSKRESNCKQHMEKAHSWVYVRSKSKGKRLAEWGYDTKAFEEPTTAEHKPSAASIPLQTSVVSQPGLDFILFDDDQADAIGEDDDSLESAESYLPWTSPSTRLRRNEQFIEMFSQTYDAHLDKSSEMTPRSIQGYLQAVDHGQLVGDVAIKVESPVTVVDTNFPIKKRHNPVDRPESRPGRSAHTAYDERQPYTLSSKARQVAPAHARHRASSQSRGDRSDDGCRPKKKSKLNPAEDFTDTSMPDIFRHAHPSIYDRNRTERYSPCHTVHREISTLVRHLSRPAHRLNVTERAIHSFDVEDADFRHPRAGVCRCCWRTFHDRQAFEVHLTRRCDKVSKGKREKWRVLHDSFTPLLDPPETALPENEPAEQAGRETLETAPGRLGGSFVPDDSDLWHETGTPPTSVPSPTLFPSATFIPSNPLDVRLVSAHEHHRLQEEHQALYERHQQLERVTQALLARQLVQEKMKHRRATSPDTKSSATGTSMRSRPTRSSGDSDRDSLVLHMDSQPTDVDVHRFMDEMEVTRQSLSRMNSGLSTTSRSTIHRVPPSPPPRRAELPTHDVSGTASPPAKRTLAHRPPLPSIPDSGYGTDERRGSLGDLPQDVPQAEVSPCPPSTAEKTEFAAPPSQGVAWGDNPFHKPPSGNPPSPQHSQHASFLTDHYDDASYGMMFYQDNHSQSHSRGSPPDFTFDYSMSQE